MWVFLEKKNLIENNFKIVYVEFNKVISKGIIRCFFVEFYIVFCYFMILYFVLLVFVFFLYGIRIY